VISDLPDYPFTPQRFEVRPGIAMSYIDEGPRDAAPIVLLHGNPSWSYYWRRLILGLRDNYRCIAPDHIGMGLSDKPGDAPTSQPKYDYTLASRVEDLDALLEHLGLDQRVTLVLHDWGGMIGTAWACRRPERVARLIVTNTAGFPNPKDQVLPTTLRLGRNSKLGQWLILKHNAFARGAARWGVVHPLDAAVHAAFVAPYDSPANRLSTLRFVQDIPLGPQDRAWPLVESTGQQLAQFADRPMQLLWGLKDFVFDRTFFEEWRRRFPHAEAIAYPDAGHYVLEDAHARMLPAIRRFLETHPL
jgi:haloalkane dehalogenase